MIVWAGGMLRSSRGVRCVFVRTARKAGPLIRMRCFCLQRAAQWRLHGSWWRRSRNEGRLARRARIGRKELALDGGVIAARWLSRALSGRRSRMLDMCGGVWLVGGSFVGAGWAGRARRGIRERWSRSEGCVRGFRRVARSHGRRLRRRRPWWRCCGRDVWTVRVHDSWVGARRVGWQRCAEWKQ